VPADRADLARGEEPGRRRAQQLLRDRVADEQRITCSVGVAGTVGLAKLGVVGVVVGGVVVVPPED